MKNKSDSRFFVRLGLDQSIRTMAEVKSAFQLLFWYIGRITVEYATEPGVRCGGVYGLAPYTDFKIAEDITRIGLPCTGNQVYKWRHALARLGYVAWLRTPAGQRTLVIGSEKFPDTSLERLPSWAAAIVDRAIGLRGGHPAETAEEITKKWLSLSQTGGAFSQGGVPFRQNGGNNIRKEFESEVEKKSVSSVKVDSREIDNSGRSTGPTDSTDLFYIGQKLRVTITEHAAYVAKYQGICVADAYPQIDAKIVQTGSQRARWASPTYVEKWLSNLTASTLQSAPRAQKTVPKYGDGMYYQWMTPEMYSKWKALPRSEKGLVYGNPYANPENDPRGLDDRLREGLGFHKRLGQTAIAEEIQRYLAGLDLNDGQGTEAKAVVGTSCPGAQPGPSADKPYGANLPPITHEEEEQISKRVWAQIMDTPKGAAIAAALLGKGPPSTRQ